jgi:hypothetical protein
MNSRRIKIEAAGDAFLDKIKPRIRLNGLWLNQAGFTAGNHVQVTFPETGKMLLIFENTVLTGAPSKAENLSENSEILRDISRPGG